VEKSWDDKKIKSAHVLSAKGKRLQQMSSTTFIKSSKISIKKRPEATFIQYTDLQPSSKKNKKIEEEKMNLLLRPRQPNISTNKRREVRKNPTKALGTRCQ